MDAPGVAKYVPEGTPSESYNELPQLAARSAEANLPALLEDLAALSPRLTAIVRDASGVLFAHAEPCHHNRRALSASSPRLPAGAFRQFPIQNGRCAGGPCPETHLECERSR